MRANVSRAVTGGNVDANTNQRIGWVVRIGTLHMVSER
jgi:hypothetical protein